MVLYAASASYPIEKTCWQLALVPAIKIHRFKIHKKNYFLWFYRLMLPNIFVFIICKKKTKWESYKINHMIAIFVYTRAPNRWQNDFVSIESIFNLSKELHFNYFPNKRCRNTNFLAQGWRTSGAWL